MKKYIVLFIVLLITQMSFGQLTLSWPIDRAVFQRNNSGNANVIIAGQSFAAPFPSNWQIQYQIRYLNKFGTEIATQTDWTAFSTPGVGKVFRVSVNVPTGWYRLNVRIMQNGTSQITSSTLKFGVGEVFVIAGQSNALGEENMADQTTQYVNNQAVTLNTYDCIIASAQTTSNKCSTTLPVYPVFYTMGYTTTSKISPNGDMPWAYTLLGRRIVDMNSSTVTPVMFFNAAMSGSEITQWSNSVTNPSGNYDIDPFTVDRCPNGTGNGGQGEPYRSLRNSLNYYSSLFGTRGIIWHQGESDTKQATTQALYAQRLQTLINATKNHSNSGLAWSISNASLICDNCGGVFQTSSQVINAQGQVRGTSNNIESIASANSDSYSNSVTVPSTNPYNVSAPTYRVGVGTHFSNSGLAALSGDYFNGFTTTTNNLFSKTPIPANPIMPVLITQVGSNKSIALNFAAIGKSSSDFTCYQWTQGDNYTNATYPPSNCGGYNPLTVTTNGSWRCYMQDTKGNVYMTQKIYINTSSSFRVSEQVIESKVYPNPTIPDFENMIEFALEKPSNVRLEIVDSNGELLQTLTDNVHAIGKFQYPFTLKKANFKDFETLYYRITIDDVTETKKIILTK